MVNSYPKQMQAILGLLMLLAIFAQSIIPAGYMPSFKSGQVFAITICHGAGETTVMVDENMKPVPSESEQHSDKNKDSGMKSCVYTSVSTKDIAFQSFMFEQSERLTYEAFVERTNIQNIVTVTPRPYFGQGPPVSLS